MIAAMGLTFVRLAEFTWALMEPSEGRFEFAWLGRALDAMRRAGVGCVLGTPSAAPPTWLTERYPEILVVDDRGVRIAPGGCRLNCPSNPTYRRLAGRVAERMAAEFGTRPEVIGWQIDNELGQQAVRRCYCDACRAGFQRWLLERYGALDQINAAWGSVFWSNVYTDVRQVPTPRVSNAPQNPGLVLDYYRYQSDAFGSFLEEQRAVVQARSPGRWITTNVVTLPQTDTIDLPRLARRLDFASSDNYPGYYLSLFAQAGVNAETLPNLIAFSHAAARGVKGGRPFLVMEEQVGKTGLASFAAPPALGQVRLWSWQAFAHGAMGMNWHRWDTPRTGAEQSWFGILEYDRTPGPSRDEIARTVHELGSLPPELLQAPCVADVALVFDYDAAWAGAIQTGTPALNYGLLALEWHGAATALQQGVDVLTLDGAFAGRRLLLAPSLQIVDERHAQAIRRFVTKGGTFVAGSRLGVKDGTGAIALPRPPGLLRGLMGVTVADFAPLLGPQALAVGAALGGGAAAGSRWRERLALRGATALATYADGPWAGEPAMTVHAVGRGRAVYLGVPPQGDLLAQVLTGALREAGGSPGPTLPAGVEMTRRRAGGREWVFLLNHRPQATSVTLAGVYRDLLSNETARGAVSLGPFGVRVLERAKP